MRPTPDGLRLTSALAGGFASIADGTLALMASQNDAPRMITTTLNFAENWLMPRISSFWAQHPDIALSINPTSEIVDLRRSGHHLSIRYGRGKWPGCNCGLIKPGCLMPRSRGSQCGSVTMGWIRRPLMACHWP
jgi:LysR family glycine cleavage system transcriptional activator